MADDVIASAKHWAELADREDSLADFFDEHGQPYGSTVPYRNRAGTYRRAAAALMLEAYTGRPHCNLCFRDHPNHLHMHRG